MEAFLNELLSLGPRHFYSFLLISFVIATSSIYVFVKEKGRGPSVLSLLTVVMNFVLLLSMFLNFVVFVLALDATGYASERTANMSTLYSLISLIAFLFWVGTVILFIFRKIKFREVKQP